MTTSNSKHAGDSAHQTVTEESIEVSTGVESLHIGFTDQKISSRAGISTCCGFLGWHRFGEWLAWWLSAREARWASAPARAGDRARVHRRDSLRGAAADPGGQVAGRPDVAPAFSPNSEVRPARNSLRRGRGAAFTPLQRPTSRTVRRHQTLRASKRRDRRAPAVWPFVSPISTSAFRAIRRRQVALRKAVTSHRTPKPARRARSHSTFSGCCDIESARLRRIASRLAAS